MLFYMLFLTMIYYLSIDMLSLILQRLFDDALPWYGCISSIRCLSSQYLGDLEFVFIHVFCHAQSILDIVIDILAVSVTYHTV